MPSLPWRDPEPTPIPPALAEVVGEYFKLPPAELAGGPALVAATLARRGLVDPQQARAFLDPRRYAPADPYELPGLRAAVTRLKRAVETREPLCVWGDFDVDGQTSTALLVSGLRSLGAEVVFHIPLRAGESHGVHIPHLREWIDEGVRLFLTCDTGVSAVEALEYAQSRGADVIVTDHHDPPEILPPAVAIVNPKLDPRPAAPMGGLPGVGVAYQLLAALLAEFGRADEADTYLDLVALGVVADLAPLYGDTRYLLQRGLERLHTPERLGVRALLEAAEVNAAGLSEEDIGFQLAPRLNALGRLGDASLGVELLTTPELGRARILAQQLEGYNRQRKLLTTQVFQAAQSQLQADPELLEYEALVLHHPAWPPGVNGIVASRLVELYARPVVLLTSPPDEPARGSARSIPGVNITAAITAAADLLDGFGGHPMAAGVALDPQNIPAFRRRLSDHIAGQRAGQAPPTLTIDAFLPLEALTLELADQLDSLAPFGPENPPLLLAARDLHVARSRQLGRAGEHRRVTVADPAGAEAEVLWWNSGDQPLPTGLFDLAFTLRSSAFGGVRSAQLTWQAYRQVHPAPVEVAPAPTRAIIDLRRLPDPQRVLQARLAESPRPVWAEAAPDLSVTALTRAQLAPADSLVIWTIPPGWSELRQALDLVSPAEVLVFANDPGTSEARPFLERLAGLVKYALRAKNGELELAELAALTAQRELAVSVGLAWLEASGLIRLEAQADGRLLLHPGRGEPTAERRRLAETLDSLLAETRAFRKYWRTADLSVLLA